MPEIAFYYHTRKSLDDTLPLLLAKSISRGWRAAVQAPNAERLRKLDEHLWSYRPDSFLPHGTQRDGEPETQPVYLTCESDNPNEADVRFLLEGLQVAPFLRGAAAPKERIVLMFDNNDVDDARAQWAALRDAGERLIYYAETDAGGWEVKAREPKA